MWRIEHFTRLKDLLKKRKITGLCIKSRRFNVGGCTCRLIVYPRGWCLMPHPCSCCTQMRLGVPNLQEWPVKCSPCVKEQACGGARAFYGLR